MNSKRYEHPNPKLKLDKNEVSELLYYLEHVEDEGPTGKGWKSKQLLNIVEKLETYLRMVYSIT